jgi:hypothetical protein
MWGHVSRLDYANPKEFGSLEHYANPYRNRY